MPKLSTVTGLTNTALTLPDTDTLVLIVFGVANGPPKLSVLIPKIAELL